MIIVVALLVSAVVLIIVHDFVRKSGRRWRLLTKFPGDYPLPLIGNALQVGFDPDETSNKLMDMWKKFGMQTFRVTMGNEDWVVLCDPEDVGVILSHPTELAKPLERNAAIIPFFGNSLSTAEGDRWRSTRKIVASSLNMKRLEQSVDVVNYHSDKLIEVLSQNVNKEVVDLYRYLKPYMFDVVCNTLMGVDYKLLDNPDHVYMQTSQKIVNMLTNTYFSYWRTIHPLFALTSMYHDMMSTIKNVKEISDDIIFRRRSTLNNKTDVIEIKKNGKISNKEEKKGKVDEGCLLDKFIKSTLPNGDPVPQAMINEEVSLLTFTGHYSTTLTMSHTLYYLAKHPEIQQRVIDEQLSIFVNDKLRKPTHDDLNEMKYLEAVVKETLRLIPTLAKIGRQLQHDLELKDGRIVPAGTAVVVFYETLSLNPEIFPEPHKFDPDRFLYSVKPYSFVPFSAGPRNCVGARYAWVAMKTTLSNIVRRFEVSVGDSTTEPQLVNRIMTESKNGVQLKIRPRVL